MIDKPLVLMPPISPQWAVAECLMWRALVQMLVLTDAKDYAGVVKSIGAMAHVVNDCAEASRSLGVPMSQDTEPKPDARMTVGEAAARSQAILETLVQLVPAAVAMGSMQLAFAAAKMWREWTVEEAAEGMDEAEREMREIVKLMQSGEPNA